MPKRVTILLPNDEPQNAEQLRWATNDQVVASTLDYTELDFVSARLRLLMVKKARQELAAYEKHLRQQVSLGIAPEAEFSALEANVSI